MTRRLLKSAINRRNPEIFKALFEEILDRVMAVAPTHKFKFKNPLYAILYKVVPVAQRIEQLPFKQLVARSIRARGTIFFTLLIEIFIFFLHKYLQGCYLQPNYSRFAEIEAFSGFNSFQAGRLRGFRSDGWQMICRCVF